MLGWGHGIHHGSPRRSHMNPRCSTLRVGLRKRLAGLRTPTSARHLQLLAIIMKSLAALALLGLLAVGCAAPQDESEDEGSTESAESARSGVNGDSCKRSPYNCSLHPGDQRVSSTTGSDKFAVDPKYSAAHKGVPVVDGNGGALGNSTFTSFTMNYGQHRTIQGTEYVYAMSTGLGSSGWVPLDAFVSSAALLKDAGTVTAHGSALGTEMGCYAIKSSYDPKFDKLKLLKGGGDDAQEPNDYLPQKRANGKVYGTISFNVPGDALGGPNVDIFPAGTKFQRLEVPTWESPQLPSLGAKMYAKAKGASTYTVDAGEMKFLYGYVKTTEGVTRYGWMALDGAEVSSGCPAR